MPYCSTAIKLRDECDWSVEKALAAIGKEMFNAETVHLLDGDSYNIDAGLNDVRAIVNSDEQLICLFCRYQKDVAKVEAKLADFGSRHSDECTLVAVDHKGMPK
ncbi:hypothetical protein [Alteromonas sp. ASW11-130]|uniref:hypothetical protein n=1 Tax=Alteromonas sp. ASW11-130 TaxID=3015775 RepID=UPI0022428CAC|nr:hypothetical protein [Alteromonas sp. ASW11-130]MCW8093209.1 hypothetical protein [Alteromonas sp. ASW11-130]